MGEIPRSEIVRHVIEYSVLAAHRHVFGVLACYSLLAVLGLGPAGAVFYRMSEFVARYWRYKGRVVGQPVSVALQDVAARAWGLIDWLPARITALGFAVVGSFEEALDSWRNQAQRFPNDWLAAIFDGEGTIAARTLAPEQYVGQKGTAEFVARILQSPEGVMQTQSREGVPTLSAWSRSPATGWSVGVGVARKTLEQSLETIDLGLRLRSTQSESLQAWSLKR